MQNRLAQLEESKGTAIKNERSTLRGVKREWSAAGGSRKRRRSGEENIEILDLTDD